MGMRWGTGSPLEGLVRHECGARMYYRSQRNVRGINPTQSFECQTASFPADRRCQVGRRAVTIANVERAVRACLLKDIAGLVSLDQAIASAHNLAGGGVVQKERSRLCRRRTGFQSQRERAEALYTSGRRDLGWFDTEDSKIASQIAEIDRALADLPQAPERDVFAQARDQLVSLGDAVAAAPVAYLARAVQELGRIIVGEKCMWIAYQERYRAYIPNPAHITY